ncbi:hypothetical protein HNQ56_001072 [Anaerotaenia torta]|uniref:discoidin domain-containing protein n=1 Tax=Anaerotaenia torta TaxID=433293 RepID=UPI003D1DDF5D
MIYGKFIKPSAFAKEGTYIRNPENVVSGADMSGYGGMEHTRGVDLEAVWLSARNVTKNVWIGFDFGSVIRLGWMCIWNLNQTDGFGAGLKRVKIFYSYDNEEYLEFQGPGYPYIFAAADGKPGRQATNLDDGKHSPVDFGGLSARYIKIVPDIESGEGCHGAYIEGQTRFGLSQVRFFLYHEAPRKGGSIYARAFLPEMDVLTSEYGMDGGLQGINGSGMYLSKANPENMDMIFDLNMCTFLKGVDFYNYNEPYMLRAGLKKIFLFESVNGFEWNKLGEYELAMGTGKPMGVTRLTDGELIRFEPVYTRYIKVTVAGGAGLGTHGCVNGFEFRYGLSKIRFISADSGYYVEPARDWSSLMSSFEGWTGADGIFITSLDGRESKPKGESRKGARNMISFGDTFIGKVNPVTGSRRCGDLVNNSFCYMEGLDPAEIKLEFFWGRNQSMEPTNLIYSKEDYIYWLQDSIITGGKFYSFTDNVISEADNLDLPEGFRFHLSGVDMVIFDIKEGRLDAASQRTLHTPLFLKDELMFGCGIFANTAEAGMDNADGYLYIYGIQEISPGVRHLVVARTRPEHITDFEKYTYFDGTGWSGDMRDSAAIADDLSPEMSVMPMDFGKDRGKYIYIYSANGVSDYIMARIGDTPYGPFGKPRLLYCMNKIEDLEYTGLKKIYQYNAKAHFNIAGEDEILMTYNVNCMDYESHLLNGNVYRPRFLRYKEF